MASNIVRRPSLFSTDDERWPLVSALTWIATRSLKYVEAFAARDIGDADALLALGRNGGGVPPGQNYAAAFDTLSQKIEGKEIRGQATKLKWIIPLEHEAIEPEQYFSFAPAPEVIEASDFHPQDLKNRMVAGNPLLQLKDFVFHDGDCLTPKGSGYGSPNPDGSRVRWSWRGVTFAREDLLRLWPDWPCFAAWKRAKAQEWRPPKNLSPERLNNISPGRYAPLAEVVTLLAFGSELLPIGLDWTEEMASRFRVGRALCNAASAGKISLCGHAAFRMPHMPGGLGPATQIFRFEPKDCADLTLVIDGAADWLGPIKYADEFPECGRETKSVAFIGVAVHRDSLRRWLAELSNSPAPQKTWTQAQVRLGGNRSRNDALDGLSRRIFAGRSRLECAGAP